MLRIATDPDRSLDCQTQEESTTPLTSKSLTNLKLEQTLTSWFQRPRGPEVPPFYSDRADACDFSAMAGISLILSIGMSSQ